MATDDPITKRVANVKIVSGGQTGVDRGALEAATALGLDLGGWAPHGWIAEDGTIPAQYRERMQEHPSMGGRAQDYRERTKANLRCLPHAWLVFGVDNKTRKVVGTDYDASPEALNRSGGIKYQITQSTDPGVCFSDVHVLDLPEGRMPHLHISAKVAMMTGQEAAYMRKKERTGEPYRRIFIDFLRRFPGITRRNIIFPASSIQNLGMPF